MTRRFLNIQLKEYIAGLSTLLACGYGDLISSYFLVLFKNYFYRYKFLVLALPAIMNLRGSSYITYSARLITKLHLGIIEPRPSLRQTSLRHELSGTLICVLLANIAVGVLVSLVYTIFFHKDGSILKITGILVDAGMIAASFVIPITTIIMIISFVKGVRPEVLAGALESVVGDVVTVPSLIAACILDQGGLLALPLAAFIATILVLLRSSHRYERELTPMWRMRKVVLETTIAALLSVILELVTGSLVLSNFERMISRSYLTFALLPPVLATCGGVCVNAAVSLTTYIHLGEVDTGRAFLRIFARAFSQSIIAYLNVVLLGLVLGYTTGLRTSLSILFIHVLLPGEIAVIMLLPVTYLIVLSLVKTGINPANFASPVIMPLCDLVTSIVYITFLLAIR